MTKRRLAPKEPEEGLPYRIFRQQIERFIITGPVEKVAEAIEYCQKHKLVMSSVGPKLVGAAGKMRDDRQFVLLAERVK